jgi:hypothetical protein
MRAALLGDACPGHASSAPQDCLASRLEARGAARRLVRSLLWQDAQDLRGVELIGRRRMLQKALKKAGPALRFSEHMAGSEGEAMFPPRLRDGPRRHHLEARHEPLQVGLVHCLGEGQELGI